MFEASGGKNVEVPRHREIRRGTAGSIARQAGIDWRDFEQAMNTYHIRIEFDGDWYVLEAVEDESVFSQSRTLDEAVIMIRDLLDLLKGEKDAELRLIVPASLPVDDTRQSGRITHAVDEAAEDAADESPAIQPRPPGARQKSA